ncbi:MAG: hypothetical protein ACFFAU_05500 [Candidatus Hodarchaeota archaeon]
MSKDKIYGYSIFLITIILLILYTIYVPIQAWLSKGPQDLQDLMVQLNPLNLQVADLVMWPVYLATLLIGFIIAWIGITMATTPPPEPIDLDDLNLDDEEFEEEEEED